MKLLFTASGNVKSHNSSQSGSVLKCSAPILVDQTIPFLDAVYKKWTHVLTETHSSFTGDDPRKGNNPKVRQQVNGGTNCGTWTIQWNTTQQ